MYVVYYNQKAGNNSKGQIQWKVGVGVGASPLQIDTMYFYNL